MTVRFPRRSYARRASVALLLLGSLFGQPGASRAEPVEAARAALPEATRASGVLRVATSLQWPPFGYAAEGGGPEGIDIRLVRLLAEKLGLRAEFEDVKFPSIVPGVANGRYDAGVNQIGITAERLAAVDFVPYFNSAFSLLVRKGTTGLDVNHLCGRTLVLTRGSAQVAVAEQISAACVKANDKPIGFLLFPNSADTYLALANGRGDGFMASKAVGIYIARGNDKLEMTTATLPDQVSTSGIVVAKGNRALQDALRLALESATSDGSYVGILDQFGVPDGAVTVQQLRGPVSP